MDEQWSVRTVTTPHFENFLKRLARGESPVSAARHLLKEIADAEDDEARAEYEAEKRDHLFR